MSSSKANHDAVDEDASVARSGADSSEAATTNREPTKGRLVADMMDKLQASTSAGVDPTSTAAKGSREESPVRLSRTASNIPQLSRSRKGSQEFSPTRSSNLNSSYVSVPSAAAVQRAMSAQRLPGLAGVDGLLDGSRERLAKSGNSSPSWPTSPRLRSPPPSMTAARHAINTLKRGELEQTSNTGVKRASSVPATESPQAVEHGDTALPHSPSLQGLRTPTPRGTSTHSGLETVEESSIPSTPSIGPLLGSTIESNIQATSLDENPDSSSQPSQPKAKEGENTSPESSQKLNGDKMDGEAKGKASLVTRPANLARRSFTSLTTTTTSKPKAVEPLRTMTVETETVPTIPQIIGVERGASGRDGGGSVKTKPSTETIRPRKEKRKPTRKTPSLHAGTVTSKADIFESKVASAVDAASSSDSDETFVYESNPPDVRPSRHHSRTPSAASQASPNEHYTGRSKLRNGSHGITGRKSMKFTNSGYNTVEAEHGSSENARGSTRNGNSTPRHHHIGRHSRAGHPSLFDTDSPFTQASKPSSPRTSGNLGRTSRPNSPRVGNGKVPGSPRKGDMFSYDIDEDGADDERAPLIGSVRINRSRHSRRPNSALPHYAEQRTGCISRYGACLIITVLTLLLCIGATTFVVALNRPLIDVSIKRIQNVLASEQELMLDLDVQATNPNLFAIIVNELDVNIFAESAWAGTTESWRRKHGTASGSWMDRRRQLLVERDAPSTISHPFWPQEGVDEGTDPIDDPDTGGPKLLLGRVFEFDSPLTFDASPVRRSSFSSVGAIRLAKPGNQTELGGSARWERVLQHPFEIIVRGVIQYQLPLSSKTKSAKIGGRVKVLPQDDTGEGDGDDEPDT